MSRMPYLQSPAVYCFRVSPSGSGRGRDSPLKGTPKGFSPDDNSKRQATVPNDNRGSQMISYLDTSSLVKKYVREHRSEEVSSHWNQSEVIITSSVAFAEFFSAINRKKRFGDISESDYEVITEDFKEEWETLFRIEVSDRLNRIVEGLTARHPIRGFDAIHLASAVHIQYLEENLSFICADRRLNDAARSENLNVIDLS